MERKQQLKKQCSMKEQDLRGQIKQDISNALLFQKLTYKFQEKAEIKNTKRAQSLRKAYRYLNLPRKFACFFYLAISFF